MSLQEHLFYFFVDGYYRLKPQTTPKLNKLQQAKIISHRGEHDNKEIFENTIAAFDRVRAVKAWGLEFDIRWTRDLVPVVFHDVDLLRLFNIKDKIAKLDFAELRIKAPLVPSLAEVVERYGKQLHLMIEVKKEDYPNPELQTERLKTILQNLTPTEDYHLISIHPEMFEHINFLPSKALLPIAIYSYRKKSQLSIKQNYGGVLGHYQFLSQQRINQHLELGHKVGVGFVESKNSLYRELNRGIEWLFSNKAVMLQKFIHSLQQNSSS